MDLEEGDVILGTVDRIVGTVVFVKINVDGKEIEGSMTFSEVAPGRIRNIRSYVVPKKKIVCKVLRIKNSQVNLSLRRVTQKEQKEIMERHKQEKSYKSIFKTILKEKAKEAIEKIERERTLYDFIEEIKQNPKELGKFVARKDAEKIIEILKSQKPKKAIVKKGFLLTTTEPNGIEKIKEMLGKIKGSEIAYITAGKYSIKTEADDRKKADTKLKEILSGIEKSAKKENMKFDIKEK